MATLTIADLDNGKRDLQTVDAVANSRAATATTRFGQQTTTLYEATRRIQAAGDEVIRNLGFRVPVPYASGIEITDSRFTVTGLDGKVYAPLSAPFTTGAWDSTQWYVLQNDLNDQKLLVFNTLVEAEAAAATLPDGQTIEVETDESLSGARTRYQVQGGVLANRVRLDLEDSAGSSRVGFTRGGVGAKVRTVQDKMRDIATVNDYTSLAEAISDAVSGGFVIGVSQNTTVRVPTDSETLQAAFECITPLNRQCQINVIIEAGHQPSIGISVSNGDFSQWKVSSEEPTVTLAPTFSGRFINCNNGFAPTLNTYIVGHSGVDRIYSLFCAIGNVAPGCGGQGAYGRILYGNSSTIQAANTIWKNYADAVYFSAGSSVQFGGALVEGYTGTANGAVVASRGSAIEAQAMTLRNCTLGFECKRAGSSINAHEATIENVSGVFVARASRSGLISLDKAQITSVGGGGLEAFAGGTISFGESGVLTASPTNSSVGVKTTDAGRIAVGNSTIQGFGVYNLEARSGGVIGGELTKVRNSKGVGILAHRGGKIMIHAGEITGSVGNDVRVQQGGEISITECTTSNSTVAGTPNVVDTNVNGFNGLNTIAAGGRGIIWG